MTTKDEVVEILKTCYDPEIPVDIWNLGLVYDINIEEKTVRIRMTLTSAGCPVAGSISNDVKTKIEAMENIEEAIVEMVWDPPWNPDMMSEEAKAQLGYY